MPCSASTVRASEKSSTMANRKSYTGFPTSHQPRFYAAPNFLKMGINYPDCRLLNNFHNKGRKAYCKVSLYKNCQRQSCSAINCLSCGINILVGHDPFPLKSWLQVTYPLLKAASFDTFCLVAPQPQETGKEVRLHLTRTRHGLSNEPSTKVLRRP